MAVRAHFESPRLQFRPPQLSDAQAIFDSYAQDPEVTRYLTWTPHKHLTDTEAFLKDSEGHWQQGSMFPWLLLDKQSQDIVGMISLRFDQHMANFGFVIARRYWNQGYATEALKATIDEAFRNPKVLRVYADCDAENLASARVMVKAGMHQEGLLKQFGVHPNCGPKPRDALIHALVRDDWQQPESHASDMQPTERFSQRVRDYERARPSYPKALLDFIEQQWPVEQHPQVADIGAGTGILTRLLLERGYETWAVEPNQAMREAADAGIHSPRYHSLGGKAEDTGLDSGSMDLITAAQAFHWFEPEATRREFERLLKPGGQVLLIWNKRLLEGDDFAVAYEAFCNEFGVDYSRVRMANVDRGPVLTTFFGGRYILRSFENEQRLDRDGLIARLCSCSYIPDPDHPRYAAMIEGAKALFSRFEKPGFENQGQVVLKYQSKLYYGDLKN